MRTTWTRPRLIRLLAAAAAAALALTACSSSDPDGESATPVASPDAGPEASGSPTPTDAGSPDDSDGPPQSGIPVLRVAWSNPNIVGSAAPYVAEALGYFDEVGIDEVQITETEDYIAGLLSGSFDIIQGDTDVLLQAGVQGNLDIRITGARLVREQSFLGVREGIASPEDLVGATVTGGGAGLRNDFLVRDALRSLDLEPDQDVTVQPINAPSNAWLEAILNGQIDGAILFERHRIPLEEAGGTALTEVIKDLPVDGFAQTQDWLDANEETMAAFLYAIAKAQRFMKDPANTEQVGEILESNGIGLDEGHEDLYVANTRNISVDLGFAPESMDQLVSEFAAIDLLPADLEWQQFVDLDALHRAQAALGLELNPTADLSSGANNRE